MGPKFRMVNLINNDTLYTAGIIDLSHGPLVLTIPPTTVTYSILPLSVFGHVVRASIPSQTPGHYALVLQGWRGTLPAGVTKITIPYPVTFWTVRGDNFSSTGVDMTAQADAFRAGGAPDFAGRNTRRIPDSGPIIDQAGTPTFATSLKVAQDAAATLTPTLYLRETQRAVHSATTKPLSASDRQLEAAFDQAFAAAQQAARRGNPVPLARIDAAVRQRLPRARGELHDAHRPHELGAFHQLRGMGHHAPGLPGPGRGKRILPALQQYNRGGLLDGVHRRGRPDAERRPAHLPADLPGRGDPAGQAVLVGHRVPSRAPWNWCPTGWTSTWSPATRRAW